MSEPLKIYGNYGAMFPIKELVIKSLSDGVAEVEHDDGWIERVKISEIRDAKPASGSSIGLYWNERDAY